MMLSSKASLLRAALRHVTPCLPAQEGCAALGCRCHGHKGWPTWYAGAARTRGDGPAALAGGGEFVMWPNGGGLVHSSAELHASVRVEAGAVVHAGARMAEGAVAESGAVLGPGVELGAGSRVGYHASLQHCSVGHSVVLHPGVRIGQDGFGFIIDGDGEVLKKPQALRVRIMHGVEIGANSCVDRGSWRDTYIGEHTKLDNMVQIGHNAVIGRGCLLCAHCAIGGSAELGDWVVMGGKAAVKDHVSVVSKVRIAAKAGVTHSLTVPGDYAGFPAVPAHLWRRRAAAQRSGRGREAT